MYKKGLSKLFNTLIEQKKIFKLKQCTKTRPGALDTHISPIESTWNEECSRQLEDLTDRLSENLINDIDQFCRRTKLELAEEEESTNLTSSRLDI